MRTIEALGVDAIVLRARQDGAAEQAAAALECPLINAGAGTQEHPTQGLLDAYVVAEAHGRLDSFDLSDLTYAIVGDVVAVEGTEPRGDGLALVEGSSVRKVSSAGQPFPASGREG